MKNTMNFLLTLGGGKLSLYDPTSASVMFILLRIGAVVTFNMLHGLKRRGGFIITTMFKH